MALTKELRLVLVTPEKTLLDEPVDALRLPLYDGQIGIRPGRAPLVGRLGYGELKVSDARGERSYFVDGGFVQVQGPIVSVLTNRSIPADELDAAIAQEQLTAASAQVATTDVDIAKKEREQIRARSMLSLAKRPRR